jgi:transposase
MDPTLTFQKGLRAGPGWPMSHHNKLGHEVKLMSPRYVRAYVKSNKNDARDA